jgi:hypothetical protein
MKRMQILSIKFLLFGFAAFLEEMEALLFLRKKVFVHADEVWCEPSSGLDDGSGAY